MISGEKTQTRRLITKKGCFFGENYIKNHTFENGAVRLYSERYNAKNPFSNPILPPKYYIGEEVAILEPYDRIYNPIVDRNVPVWQNKMFMPAIYARYGIRITGIRSELLWDIESEDALAEGIDYSKRKESYKNYLGGEWFHEDLFWNLSSHHIKHHAQEMSLISLFEKFLPTKLRNQNWWVWVYEFELVHLKPALCR